MLINFIFFAETQVVYDSVPKLTRRRGPDLKAPEEPCGVDCYLNLDGMKEKIRLEKKIRDEDDEESNDSRYSKEYPAVRSNDKDEPMSELGIETDSIWNGSDQSMYRMLQRVYRNNYCSIAKALIFKTCRQVC